MSYYQYPQHPQFPQYSPPYPESIQSYSQSDNSPKWGLLILVLALLIGLGVGIYMIVKKLSAPPSAPPSAPEIEKNLTILPTGFLYNKTTDSTNGTLLWINNSTLINNFTVLYDFKLKDLLSSYPKTGLPFLTVYFNDKSFVRLRNFNSKNNGVPYNFELVYNNGTNDIALIELSDIPSDNIDKKYQIAFVFENSSNNEYITVYINGGKIGPAVFPWTKDKTIDHIVWGGRDNWTANQPNNIATYNCMLYDTNLDQTTISKIQSGSVPTEHSVVIVSVVSHNVKNLSPFEYGTMSLSKDTIVFQSSSF